MITEKPFIYLAPLRGITDHTFRNLFHKYFPGIDAAIAPFINPHNHTNFSSKLLNDVHPDNNPLLPVIPQILNNNPDDFLDLADRLQDMGFNEINWNLGCPAPMVTKKRRGSGLLPFPDQIISLLEQVFPKLKMELSIKTRLGWNDNQELPDLLPALDAFPLKEIIIHSRLGTQAYRGQTDPDAFEYCCALTRHQLVYNGDIIDLDSYGELQQRFPSVKRWMLGRGLLADPFLAGKIKGENLDRNQQVKLIQQFHQEIYAAYQLRFSGPGHLIGRMKQLWSYMIVSFDDQNKVWKKIKKTKTVEQYERIIYTLFENEMS